MYYEILYVPAEFQILIYNRSYTYANIGSILLIQHPAESQQQPLDTQVSRELHFPPPQDPALLLHVGGGGGGGGGGDGGGGKGAHPRNEIWIWMPVRNCLPYRRRPTLALGVLVQAKMNTNRTLYAHPRIPIDISPIVTHGETRRW